MNDEVLLRSPIPPLVEDGGLAPGQLGGVGGPSGVGKSAVLAHLGLHRVLLGQSVLHVSVNQTADAVRLSWSDLLDGLARTTGVRGRERELLLERTAAQRQIICRPAGLALEDLDKALEFLGSLLDFHPSLVLLDGWIPEDLGALSALLEKAGASAWLTGLDPASCASALELAPMGAAIELRALRLRGVEVARPPVRLDPATMQRVFDEGSSTGRSPNPRDCTLYSGGAAGAEAAFGEAAGRWSVNEVNFTFDGHRQERSVGSVKLGERELAAGDVSLVYVSKRLNRTYSEGTMIRPVLQSLWHQVSRAQQVFVVGEIQNDGTVTGGTGWSVELARMWRKNLWVFDQEKSGWFRWNGEAWTAGVPVIESPHFCGTGTRYLRESARSAIVALFDRSFRA